MIALTEELLATAKQNEVSGSNASASATLSEPKENEVVFGYSSYLTFLHFFSFISHYYLKSFLVDICT